MDHEDPEDHEDVVKLSDRRCLVACNPPEPAAAPGRLTLVVKRTSRTAVFRLKFSVPLACHDHDRTTLVLYIKPDSILSLQTSPVDGSTLPTYLATALNRVHTSHSQTEAIHLHLTLSTPPDLVAPAGATRRDLTLRDDAAAAASDNDKSVLDACLSFARQRVFHVYMPGNVLTEEGCNLLRSIMARPGGHGLRALNTAYELASLYAGRGGVVVNLDDEQQLDEDPPSYTQPGTSEGAGADANVDAASEKSRGIKRRRRSPDDECDADNGKRPPPSYVGPSSDIGVQILEKLDAMEKSIGSLHSRLTTLDERLSTLETKYNEDMSKCNLDMDVLSSNVDYVDREVGEVNDRISILVEDAVLDYKLEVEAATQEFKDELQQHVEGQMEDMMQEAVASVESRAYESLQGRTVHVENVYMRIEPNPE